VGRINNDVTSDQMEVFRESKRSKKVEVSLRFIDNQLSAHQRTRTLQSLVGGTIEGKDGAAACGKMKGSCNRDVAGKGIIAMVGGLKRTSACLDKRGVSKKCIRQLGCQANGSGTRIPDRHVLVESIAPSEVIDGTSRTFQGDVPVESTGLNLEHLQ